MLERIAIVTGGARGIGAAVCRLFANKGYGIVFTYNSSGQSAKGLLEELSGKSRIEAIQADVSQKADVERLFNDCRSTFGRLDVLVNCASYSSSSGWNAKPDSMHWNEWQKTIDIDLKGTMMCCHAGYELMKQEGGKIINFSSSASLYGDVPTYFYTAAKSAVVGVTRTLARMFAPTVQVNCVAPGSIATDWITKWKLTPEDLEQISKESPSGRIGKPEEVAELVSFLASPECTYMTGQTLIIDGGIYML